MLGHGGYEIARYRLTSSPVVYESPPGGLARIIADLREEQHSHGTVVCYEGEAAQIFILQSLEPRRFWLTEAGISVKSLL